MITGAIISSLSENPAELNWRRAKTGTRDSARTPTTFIYVFFIMSWVFLESSANQKQLLSYPDSCGRKAPNVLSKRDSFSSFLRTVRVVVYRAEGHVPKLNSAGKTQKKSYSEADCSMTTAASSQRCNEKRVSQPACCSCCCLLFFQGVLFLWVLFLLS